MRCGCRYRERVRPAPLVAVAVLGGLGLGLPAEPAAQPVDAVQVVPFANLSRQAADEWIGAGIAETVSSDLRNLGVPVVVDDGSAGLARAGRAAGDGPALAAGRTLGARWLVAGGYQRVGDRLRITARLVDTTTGEVRRHTRVDGYLADLFDAQDRIVEALADAFAPNRSPDADLADRGRLPGLAAGHVDSGADGPDQENVVRAPGGAGPFGGGRGRSGDAAVGGTGVTGVLDLGETEAAVSPVPGNGNGNGLGNGVDGASQPRRTATVSAPRPGGGFAAAPIARRRVTIGRAAQPPNLDGRLDDAVWETATYIDDFVQIAPVEGAPGTGGDRGLDGVRP